MMRGKKIAVLCAGLLVFCLAGAAVLGFSKPLDDQITVDGLSGAAADCEYILVKAENSYYELQGTDAFAELFDFDAWQQQDKAPSEEPILTLRFAESWILEFASDGTAAAYNGYASAQEQSEAYYSVPPQTAEELLAYIQQYGEPHELGDGTISSSTFHD